MVDWIVHCIETILLTSVRSSLAEYKIKSWNHYERVQQYRLGGKTAIKLFFRDPLYLFRSMIQWKGYMNRYIDPDHPQGYPFAHIQTLALTVARTWVHFLAAEEVFNIYIAQLSRQFRRNESVIRKRVTKSRTIGGWGRGREGWLCICGGEKQSRAFQV